MKTLFLSKDSELHKTIATVFASEIKLVTALSDLHALLLKEKSGLIILDAEYGDQSGYSICEDIKSRFGDQWRVHLFSNEISVGEREKADYALVDRLFILPNEIEELVQYE